MNTVLVPIDFSETSLHAATYAAQLLAGHLGVTMVLYHAYSKDSEADEALKTLNEIEQQLEKKYTLLIEVLNHKEDDFVSGLERAVRHRNADLVIMGITGRSAIAQVFIGSNTLKFASTKACPVLIIPEQSVYREINNVMLASDFKNTFNTTPSVPIKSFLKIFRPKLHIVNVDPTHYISLSETYEKEKIQLSEMFSMFNPEFYFMRLHDVDEALQMFAEEKDIDLIISIQHNYSFMEKLFKRSRTKNLSYHSNVPILVVHE
jgi:nucleotide-binding universal stress UspA family protein